jgi:MFS family permease
VNTQLIHQTVGAEADATFRKVAWRIIPLLVVSYILAFVDRANVGFAKLQFAQDLGFSEAVYGLGGGLFYLGYSLFEVPSNLILAKVGIRVTLLRIMVLWSLCSAALAFMSTPTHYYVLRTMLGAAEAGFFPGILFYLTTWIPASRRSRFTALFMSSIAISGLVGGPISGFILHTFDGVWGLRGWQWMFLAEALPSAVMGVVAYFVLSDSPKEASWLSENQRAIILAELRSEAEDKKSRSHSAFSAALLDKRFYVLVGMSVGLIAGIAGIFLWLPTVIRQSGVANLSYVGLISAVPFAVGIAAQQLIARHSDRLQERRWHAAVPTLVAAFGWGLLPQFTNNPWMALLLMTLVTAGCLGATGPFWTMPALYLTGAAAAGGIALITTIGGIGAFFSPAIVGWMTSLTGSLDFGLYYYAFIMAAGALLMLVGTRPRVASSTELKIGEASALR